MHNSTGSQAPGYRQGAPSERSNGYPAGQPGRRSQPSSDARDSYNGSSGQYTTTPSAAPGNASQFPGSGKRRGQQQPAYDQQRQYSSQAPAADFGSRGQQQEQPGRRPEASRAPPVEVAPVHILNKQQATSVRFADFDIADETKRAVIQGMGYENCFQVQAQAIPICLQGMDVMAKAKTGSGKTIAFMIPAIETILKSRRAGGAQQQASRAPGVKVLVLSPTRELASQISQETDKLLAFHPTIKAMVAVGGVKVDKHIRQLQGRVPEIMVATPGRCMELLTDAGPDVRRVFAGVQVLVMDEADTLLDMGFRPAITKILGALPPRESRQTLLFSATFPSEVSQLASLAMRPGKHQMVDCVGGEVQTNVQVEQQVMVVPMEEHITSMIAILTAHIRDEPEFKAVVFFPTARMTQMYAQLAQQAGFPILEMHSRKSQPHRDKMSAAFRVGSKLMMFSSDVSARGVDYPDVTLVLQVGAASDKAQYIHRVGRTGRAGKAGKAMLILSDYESSYLSLLSDLPMKQLAPLPRGELEEAARKVALALRRTDKENLERAYVTWLGYYRTHSTCKRLQAVKLVELANKYAVVLGMTTPPAVSAQAAGKMGLRGTPGLIVEKGRPGGR